MFLIALLFACQPEWASPSKAPSSSLSDANEDGPTNTDDPQETEENRPPVATILVRDAYFIGDTIHFDGSDSSDPQGSELQYSWSCSNGVDSSASSLSFLAEVEGEIECSLSVEAESGLSHSVSKKTTILQRPENADWTVMLFIAGDNNLEEAGIEDINEMERVGSTDRVNLLVQLDRSPYYTSSHGNWTGARRYYITQDASDRIRSPVMEDLGLIDSGDPAELLSFAQWGIENYPAEKYAFIIWNHGWSWSLTTESASVKGISSDDSTGNDISVAEGELEDLLSGITEISGGKLEFLGYDACVMQSWEVAHVSAPYAHYLAASQDYVSFDGWDYENSMQDLVDNPFIDGGGLGLSIAYRFFQSGDATKSVLDLSLLPAFEAELDQFSQLMIAEDAGDLFLEASQTVYSYDGSQWGEDHDIGGLLSYVASETDSTALADQAVLTKQALEEMVILNYVQDDYSDATGLNIYSPPNRDWGLNTSYLEASWSQASRWDDMLLAFQ